MEQAGTLKLRIPMNLLIYHMLLVLIQVCTKQIPPVEDYRKLVSISMPIYVDHFVGTAVRKNSLPVKIKELKLCQVN